VGAGRSADVFEHGSGEVLRRYHHPRDTEREVAAMEYARAHGFPAPAARAVNDTEIVMERVDGPTMLEAVDLERHPAELAYLHRRLHEIPFEGATLLHRDLHPANVILAADGPVVIDWTNAAAGDAAVDVALVWVILIGTGLALAERFARDFVSHFEGWETGLSDALAFRLADPNVTDEERARLRTYA
jgi:tRNA A-37 threonylcarbamoyl transferase component Bud32